MTPLEPNTYYHIFNHANGSENLFVEEKNYTFFLSKYQKYISPIANTWAYCLMPNHFHFLVRIKRKEELMNLTLATPTFPKFETLEKLIKSDKTLPKFETLEELSKENLIIDKQISLFLSKQFSKFFSSYTQSFNKMYQRKGSLFMKNFKRKEIDSNLYFQKLIAYIHTNPIHHGFTNISSIVDVSKVIDYHDNIERFIKIHELERSLILDTQYTLE